MVTIDVAPSLHVASEEEDPSNRGAYRSFRK